MKAEFTLHPDKRFKKRFTISAVLRDDQGEVFGSTDIHGRYKTPSEARAQAVCWVGIQEYEIGWGTTQVSTEPPQITTVQD